MAMKWPNNTKRLRGGNLNMSLVEEEAAALERDIAELEQKIIEQKEYNRKLKIWKTRNFPDVPQDDEITRVILEGLKFKIDLVKEFSPFTFTKASVDVVKQDDLTIETRRSVQGFCGEVQFKIDMEVTESLEPERGNNLTKLSFAASKQFSMHQRDNVKRFVEQRDVQGILCLVQLYTKWTEARDDTFQHFSSTYPDIVSINDKHHTLEITHGKCKIIVHWDLKVHAESTLFPDLWMEVEFPEYVDDASLKQTLPEKFQLMLTELGIEKTINCLIALVENR